MLPRLLLLVLSLSLFGCASTPPSHAPSEIPLPPVTPLGKCPAPEALPDMATANELADFASGALKYAACERARAIGLLEAWPK